jgi:tetratricopeptide (TPR) repeat protein
MGKASRQKKTRDATTPTERTAPRPLPQTRVTLAGDAPASWLHGAAALSVAVLAWFIYQPCLSGEFVFDDHNAILQSLLVRTILPLSRFVTHSNRPLMDFSFAVNYAQGEYDTWWFHATNVALHILTAIVLYFLAVRTLRLPAFADRYAAWSQPIAWIAAAIFACHPLATDTVAYISSRSEGLAGLFYLLTMFAYSVSISAGEATSRRRAKYAIPVLTALALGSKEVAATIPLALVLYDFVFVARGDIRHTRTRAGVIAFSTIPLLLGGAYFVARAFVSGTLSTPYQQSAGFGFDRYTPLQYLSTQFGVVVHYMRLLVYPTGLNFDYDWPLATSPFEVRVALPLLVLVAATVLAVRSLRSHPFVSFAVFFMILVLAPTSSFMPLADLAVERRMYIPLAGFALCAAAAGADLMRALAKARGLTVLVAAALIAVGVLSAVTRARATQWGDHLVLYEDAVKKSPGSPRVRLNLGVVHLNAGRRDEAHDVLFEAKRLYDEGKSIHAFPRIGAFIHYNLGAILYIREEFDKSMEEMRRAIEIGGHYVALRPRSYAVIGHIYRHRNNYAAAEEAFTEALKYNRDHPEWMHSLADVQIEQGKIPEARQTLFRLHHTHPEVAESDESARLRQRMAEWHQKNRGARRQTSPKVAD